MREQPLPVLPAVAAFTVVAALTVRAVQEADRYSDWSEPVNVGAPVNTAFPEQGANLSRDGLTLHFTCLDCPGGFGGFDIWVSTRTARDLPWSPPVNLGPGINTSANESAPFVTTDGHRLFFNSDRAGGSGGQDIYVTRRHSSRDNFSWQTPVNLGSAINSVANDVTPVQVDDESTDTRALYFASNRPGGFGGDDIYVSFVLRDETFSAPALVAELNSPANDRQPAVSRRGTEFFLASDRAGTFGNLDLWVSRRKSVLESWSNPENLGTGINSPRVEAGPSLSFDETDLYFHRPGDPRNVSPLFDLWKTSRTKLRGPL